MELAAKRNLQVNYYEKDRESNIWIAESKMLEEEHDIISTLEINMEEMIILGATFEFKHFPLEHCKLIEDKADQLIGMKIDSNFSRNILKIFMGPEGCPNIMTLLNISIPGIMYYYYPYKIRKGELTKEHFFEILKEKERNACIAHTILFKN